MSGTVLQFPLRLGLAEDENPKQKPVSALKTGANIRWPRAGQIGKRWGTVTVPVALAAGGNLSGIQRFVLRGNELSVTDGQNLYTLDDAADVWRQVDNMPEIGLEWSTFLDENTGVASADVALSGDLLVLAWVTGDPTRHPEDTTVPTGTGSLFVQVTNRTTGQTIVAPTRIGSVTAEHVRVHIEGGYAFVFFSEGANIKVQPVTLSGSYTIGSIATLKSDRVNTSTIKGRFDVMFLASGDLALVYEGASTITAARYTRSGSSFSSAVSVDHADGALPRVLSLAICEDAGASRIWILYGHIYSSPSARVRLRAISNSTMASAVSVATLEDGYYASQVAIRYLGSANSTLCAWSGFGQGSYDVPSLISEQYSSTSAVAYTRRRSMTLGLLTRIFALGSRLYAFACDSRDGEDDGNINSRRTYLSSFLVQVESAAHASTITGNPPHRMVGKVDNDIAGVTQIGSLPGVATVDASTVYAPVSFQATAAPESIIWRCGLRNVRATANVSLMADPWRSVKMGQETAIGGGRFSAWDGRTVFDYGMRTPVILTSSVDNVAGGTLSANSTFIYQFEPGYRSRAGVLHRGPMSATISVATSTANRANVTVASHGIDGKQTTTTLFGANGAGPVNIDAFRSEANGSVLYKLTIEPRYNVLVNDPTAATVTLSDDDADSVIGVSGATVNLSTRPQPYVATGELEDVQPPGCYTLHSHQRRVGIITGARREYWYTKDANEVSGVAPGFNPAQIELYDEDLTAAASLDEKRIMFSERRIWFVVGDGPTVAGTDNRFQTPQQVQSDVGCTNPRSVVSWPRGVMFQNGVDLHNLSRGLEVQWIGKDARDKLEAYPVITSAVLVSSEGEVRFTCNNTAGTAGIVLVFDYVRGTWMTRGYPGGAALVDACLYGGAYYLATATTVRVETTASNLDDSTFAPSSVVLAPIAPSGPSSWHRVRRAQVVGTSVSNHQLTIAIARDYSSSTQQTKTFAAGTRVTEIGPLEHAQVDLSVQKVQAVEIQISDAAPANTTSHPLGTGAGFTLDGVALLVQPKRGPARLTPSQRG